jgi:hypothetical protein
VADSARVCRVAPQSMGGMIAGLQENRRILRIELRPAGENWSKNAGRRHDRAQPDRSRCKEPHSLPPGVPAAILGALALTLPGYARKKHSAIAKSLAAVALYRYAARRSRSGLPMRPLSMRKASFAKLLHGRPNRIFLDSFEQGEIGPDLFRHARMWAWRDWFQGATIGLIAAVGPRLGQGEKPNTTGDAAGQKLICLAAIIRS